MQCGRLILCTMRFTAADPSEPLTCLMNRTVKRLKSMLPPVSRVTRFLDQLIEIYGVPAALRCDNGPEFIAQQFVDWCKDKGIQILFIQPGKPDQNSFIERFNRTYRNGVLDAYLFDSISEVQQITDDWIKRYNEQRPHDSLGKLPPAMYRQQLLAKGENSTLEMST
jgi:putative transposase